METLEQALTGLICYFNIARTFDEMQSDVHQPEKYGIYQSVAILRAGGLYVLSNNTNVCGNWRGIKMALRVVINYTNPMTLDRTLYEFPDIKAFWMLP